MQYKAISADGHVNEPPDLWTTRLPVKMRDRGPHVIETPKTKGHAWIMEGQQRPAPMGNSTMFFRSSGRFDRGAMVQGFKRITDRGVRYEDILPGSYDPAARVKEMLEGDTEAEVLFNGAATVWNALKLCKDHELSLACFKVYNDWIAEFQAYDPERLIGNGTLPTTGIDDCIDELHRCVGLGLRTVQLEAYPSGSFVRPSEEDDRFWAAAVELDMAINVHTNFFFATGDIGGNAEASKQRAKNLGIDVKAGTFPAILFNMIASGVFERFPNLKFVGTEVHTGWVAYFLDYFDDSVLRNRHAWTLPLLPSEYFRRNVTVVYTAEEAGQFFRYRIGVGNILWGPDYPHSSCAWPFDYQFGREILERAGATEGEIERIMWKSCADLYKIPYDMPVLSAAVA